MATITAVPEITGLDPQRVVEGGRLWLRGHRFPQPSTTESEVSIAGVPAHVSCAASDRLAVIVPHDVEGGLVPVKVAWAPGATLFVSMGATAAAGVHQVDSPVFDRDGNLYVTYSGARGQEAAVSIFRVVPNGAREPFATGIVNATGMAMGPDGLLYISSRFEGRVYRVFEDGRHEVFASDLGTACGLAFGPDGSLFVGDRSGTIFHVHSDGRADRFASLPPSVAAFHLAMGPDEAIYATAPTLSTYDYIYRIDSEGHVAVIDATFGRPQGLAFDRSGRLHVAEALAGSSGIYRLSATGPRELVASGPRLVGLAFAPDGSMAVASPETVYRFAA
jgi:sugar lactone lactonase YvrE